MSILARSAALRSSLGSGAGGFLTASSRRSASIASASVCAFTARVRYPRTSLASTSEPSSSAIFSSSISRMSSRCSAWTSERSKASRARSRSPSAWYAAVCAPIALVYDSSLRRAAQYFAWTITGMPAGALGCGHCRLTRSGGRTSPVTDRVTLSFFGMSHSTSLRRASRRAFVFSCTVAALSSSSCALMNSVSCCALALMRSASARIVSA